MPLVPVPLVIDESPLPPAITARLTAARLAVEAFQDVWDRRPIEQFVAADYELVYRGLCAIDRAQLAEGRRFCEWGCGFAVVAGLAAELGWDAVGIEAEPRLLDEARRLIDQGSPAPQLVHGNFLPRGAESLADDPLLPSLSHHASSAYSQLDLEIDDFALIYAYPWPGEELFIEEVFQRYAREGALLLLFCGAYDLRLWRKESAPAGLPIRRRRAR